MRRLQDARVRERERASDGSYYSRNVCVCVYARQLRENLFYLLQGSPTPLIYAFFLFAAPTLCYIPPTLEYNIICVYMCVRILESRAEHEKSDSVIVLRMLVRPCEKERRVCLCAYGRACERASIYTVPRARSACVHIMKRLMTEESSSSLHQLC